MPDRAASIISIFIAPIYNRRISSAYALNGFDSTITLGKHRQMHLTDTRQLQFTAIGLPDVNVSKYICGTQESTLDGRGITATALPTLGTATAPKIRMNFNSILFNTMALPLSVYDTDCCENGIAVLTFVGLNYFITRLGE